MVKEIHLAGSVGALCSSFCSAYAYLPAKFHYERYHE
jgi:hypothetical protein